MYQIVYASEATQDFPAAELKKLLLRSRLRNSEVGVTGMLVFHDGMFLQALEGESCAVNEVFARIEADPRHTGVAVLHRGPGPEQRVFGDWAMGFMDFVGGAQILKGFVRLSEHVDLKQIDSARAVELLTAVHDDDDAVKATA